VTLKHPSIPKLPRAPRHRARDLTIVPGVHLVLHASSWYQVILRHNHRLVCVMLLCQMLAEGVCHHQCVALVTHNHPTAPLPSQSCPPTQPGIGVFRQLNAYPPRGADHSLCLLCIGFEANTGEEANYDIERPLKEFWVVRCQVRIIDIEYGKESGHQTVDLVRFKRAPFPQFPQPLPCNGIHKDIEQLSREGATLCDAPPCLKWHAIINGCSAYHFLHSPRSFRSIESSLVLHHTLPELGGSICGPLSRTPS
jgi:hypothetical protein